MRFVAAGRFFVCNLKTIFIEDECCYIGDFAYAIIFCVVKNCTIDKAVKSLQIISARYKNASETIELTPMQIEAHLYENVYRGNLFCTTIGCEARIVYVHRVGNSSYFRTWKRDNHAVHCNYYFERSAGRVGGRADEVIQVAISPQKKKKALEESYLQAKKHENLKLNITNKRKTKENPTTIGKKTRPYLQLVLFDGEEEEAVRKKGYRAPRLLKRDVNALRESDVGKIRVVNGIISNVEYDQTLARIRIEREKVSARVIFGEAFFANSPNYEGLFHHIQRYASENQNVIFIGIGEVRIGSDGYELFIFHGESSLEKKQWTEKVIDQLVPLISITDTLYFHAGENYVKYLIPKLEEQAFSCYRPLQGLGIGKQMKWYKRNQNH